MFLLNFLIFVSWLEDHTYVVLNNILSPRRGSPSLGLCIGTTFKKRPKQAQRLCFNAQPSSLGCTSVVPPCVALHISVGPYTLAFSPSHHRSALLSPTPRGWTVCVVVGPSRSS